MLTSIRKVCKFVHFTGGEKLSNFAHFYQESVQICSLYWWENFYQESVQTCSLYWWENFYQESDMCKFVHFTGGENFYQESVQTCSLYWWENVYQESVQICSLYWWGEGEQFCSLLSGNCANLFTLLVGRR